MGKFKTFGKQNKKTNKGFTLVELIVVLVLLVILIGLGIAGILTWQDWSRFKKENTAAETIFYAAQNQLSELSATGVYKEKVTKVMQDHTECRLDKPGLEYKTYFNGSTIKYGSGNTDYYKWQPDDSSTGIAVWANTPPDIDDEKKADYQGSIYHLSASAGDYSHYMKEAGFAEEKPATKLLFDLITPYISDKSILDGAIELEFSPEAMQVFSVCYSDRLDGFTYQANLATDKIASVLDRSETVRRDKQIGYFATDSMSVPLEGMGQTIQGNVELINRNTLDLVIREDNIAEDTLYNVTLCRAAGTTPDKTKPLMSFSFKPQSLKTSAQDAANQPVEVEVTFSEGSFKDSTKTLRIPIWHNDTVDGTEIILILDAADVQAQSYLYAEGEAAPDSSFLNTFSFYRYGFDLSEITKIGCVVQKETEATGVSSNTECPTFATITSSEGVVTYTMENGRHLYNVRYETDYKTGDHSRVFCLNKDIDWKEFTGQIPTASNDGKNWFLDSYGVNKNAGIMYDGMDHTINRTNEAQLSRDTSKYSFPGFRSLGKGDEFTGLPKTSAEGAKPYTISNLTITFAGNLTYGVYGKTAKEEWLASNRQNQTKFGQKNIKTSDRAMSGKLPLGLFAENYGEIDNLQLNAHKVIGMEELPVGQNANTNTVIYTNMVGGFVGNNLGVMENLTLRDAFDPEGEDTRDNEAGVTLIRGKTDVGGILGRQSWTFTNNETELKNLSNYGKVTGMENVGGIVGRAYVIRQSLTLNGTDNAFNSRKPYYADGYEIYGSYAITDGKAEISPGNSLSGETVSCVEKIIITDCHNRGLVCGDELVHNGKVIQQYYGNTNGVNTYKRCANIGGVAGITMDGYFLENTSKDSQGKYWFEQLNFNSTGTGEDNSDIRMRVSDCDSYRLYTAAEYDALISKSGYSSIENETFKGMLQHDYYVGGLVGYARLTAFDNCSNEPTDKKNNQEAFVLGRNYVGGMFGCFDTCRFATPTDTTKRYVAENYANVIGIMHVGGFAGGAGIGDEGISSFSFKNPAANEGSQPTCTPGFAETLSGICNHGVVLGARRDQWEYKSGTILYDQDRQIGYGVKSGGTRGVTGAPDADVGGVLGSAVYNFKNLDNIQDDATKKFALRLAGFTNYNSITVIGAEVGKDITADSLIDVQNYSLYGGCVVAGIVGRIQNNVKINMDKTDYSKVSAVVWGFDSVGGIFGCSWAQDNGIASEVRNSYPDGAIILGREMVGGIGGRGTLTFNNGSEDSLNKEAYMKYPFRVVGRYGVGGAFGLTGIPTANAKNIRTYISKGSVEGKALVGGFAGLCSGATTNMTGSVEGVSVKADYFVGGVFGGMYNGHNSKGAAVVSLTKEIVAKNNTIEANVAFAGGYTGLYGAWKRNYTASDDCCFYYDHFVKVTGYNTGTAQNPIMDVLNRLEECSDNNGKLVAVLKTISADDNDQTQNGLRPNASYNAQTLSAGVQGGSVKAPVFAGGIFGFIPDGMKMTIDCSGVENTVTTSVEATASVSANTGYAMEEQSINDTNYPSRHFSYVGGIIGRVPVGMTITKASYQGVLKAKGSYQGQIAEVNCGKIENSCISTYVEGCTKHTFTGGLAGLNSTSGSFGSKNVFLDKTTLGGSDYPIVGGLCGENISANLSGNIIFSDDKATAIQAKDAAGLIAGYNGEAGVIDTYSSVAENRFTSTKIQNTPYAGVYTGINAGRIKNSQVEKNLNNGTLLKNIKLTDTSLNAVFGTNGTTYTGLITGKNLGTIEKIAINGTVSGRQGEIRYANAYTYLGGVAGQNGEGAKKGIIQNCYSTIAIGDAEKTEFAGGITALLGGDSELSGCINGGNVTAKQYAGGISATAGSGVTQERTVTYDNCVNLGTLSATTTAGIAGSTNETGIFTLCRNYGTGASYGITAGNAQNMSKCLDNSGLNEGSDESPAQPLSPNDNLFVRNFYLYGVASDVTVPAETTANIYYNETAFSLTPLDEVISYKYSWHDDEEDVDKEDEKTAKEIFTESLEWREYLMDRIQGESPDRVLWYALKTAFGNNADQLVEYFSSLFAWYCFNHQSTAPGTIYGDEDLRNEFMSYAADVIATGKLNPQDGDTKTEITIQIVDDIPEDDSHWPVQLYAHTENKKTSLYYKRDYYYPTNITELTLDPLNLTKNNALNRFKSLDALFVSMANDETNYPNNDTEDKKGFVKTE